MADQAPTVQSIYRYPVKGLSPEPLERARLAVGETVPGDRLYAIENGPSGFDPAAPGYQPKQRYLMLMRNERLAHAAHPLRRRHPHAWSSRRDGREAVRGDLRTPDGPRRDRAVLRGLLRRRVARAAQGAVGAGIQLFGRGEQGRVDHQSRLGRGARRTPSARRSHPLRFRGNVYVTGWPAWHEFDLLGREIAIGTDARLKIVKRIVRCAATNVDPDTGMRDLAIPETLMQTFGHADCGVYGEVVATGDVTIGDPLG